jgi:hypothetical protein
MVSFIICPPCFCHLSYIIHHVCCDFLSRCHKPASITPVFIVL